MTEKTHYWLYNIGLLETLHFCHEYELQWFLASQNNRFVYSDYFIDDMHLLPGYKKVSLT